MLCSRVLCFLAERGRVQLVVDVRQFRCVLSICHGTGHSGGRPIQQILFSMEIRLGGNVQGAYNPPPN